MKKIIILSLLLSSCASLDHAKELEEEVYYPRDLKIEVDKLISYGIAIEPKKAGYKIKIYANRNHDYLIVRSCMRDVVFENKGKTYEFNYYPMAGIEDKSSCPLMFYQLDKKNYHGFGMMIISEERYQFKGALKCNGYWIPQSNVSACQSKEGLIQEIYFDKPFKVMPESRCSTGNVIVDDKYRYQYKMPPKQCVYLFRADDGSEHLHYSIGYEQTIIKE